MFLLPSSKLILILRVELHPTAKVIVYYNKLPECSRAKDAASQSKIISTYDKKFETLLAVRNQRFVL